MSWIPENYIENVRALVVREDEMIFETCKMLADGWIELGPALIHRRAKEEGWSDSEKEGKTHSWFIESLSAEINKHPTSMYDRKRVGTNIIRRELLQENMSYSVCTALLRNTSSNHNGVIPVEEVKDRIEWFNDETDKPEHGGKPPSPRDIQKHFRRHGERGEWEIYWSAIRRNLEEILRLGKEDQPVPAVILFLVRQFVKLIEREESGSSNVNVVSTGGNREREASKTIETVTQVQA